MLSHESIMIAVFFIVSSNLMILIIILVYLWFTAKRIARADESLARMSSGNEDAMVTFSEEVAKRLQHTNRWQKILAKMIAEDREELRTHDKNVAELHSIARQIRDKYLND